MFWRLLRFRSERRKNHAESDDELDQSHGITFGVAESLAERGAAYQRGATRSLRQRMMRVEGKDGGTAGSGFSQHLRNLTAHMG